MDMWIGRRDITKFMLKTALTTMQSSIIEHKSKKLPLVWVLCRGLMVL